MRTWWPLLALAGCSFPTRPGPPFACAGAALPTTAPDPVQIHGNVSDPVRSRPLSGAMVNGHLFNKAITDPSPGGMDTFQTVTDSDGDFQSIEPTGETPHMGFVLSRQVDYLDTYAYPARPIASDFNVSFFQFAGLELGGLLCLGCPRIGELCQACPQSPADPAPAPDPSVAHLIVSVVDCNDNAVAGATVTVTRTGTGSASPVVYFKNDTLDPDATSTDEKRGSAVVTGLPAGLITIHASVDSAQFLDNTVLVTPNAVTFAEISP
jgi:hypothetical protein